MDLKKKNLKNTEDKVNEKNPLKRGFNIILYLY